MEHQCDKALIIESQSRQIGELFEGRRESERRITEMETTLYGAERNGGGFIKATQATLEAILAGQTDAATAAGEMSHQIKSLASRKRGVREVLVAAIPSIGVLITAIVAWLLTKGAAP